jgi:hypothetical protein
MQLIFNKNLENRVDKPKLVNVLKKPSKNKNSNIKHLAAQKTTNLKFKTHLRFTFSAWL